jgi:hypothetical protein
MNSHIMSTMLLLLLLLLHVCKRRRAYCRVSDSWRGNLLVQGLRNVADNISHKVGPQDAFSFM